MITSTSVARNLVNDAGSDSRHALLRTRKSWLMLALLLATVGLFAPRPGSAATTAVLSCNPCASVSDMLTAANGAYTTLPNRSYALMTSLNEPVASILQLQCSPPGKGGGCLWAAITSSNGAAAALDNLVYARALKLPPIRTGGNPVQTDEDEIIAQFVQTQLVATGPTGTDYWHMLQGMPKIQWFAMKDVQTGQVVDIYVGDTITIDYGNGYTEQWQFLGTIPTIQWKRVPNTLMYKGQPVTPPNTTSGTPASGYGSGDYNSPFTGGGISLVSQQNYCWGTSSTSIQDPSTGNWITSFGIYTFPC